MGLQSLSFYQPHPKQAEFHAAGATQPERLLMAGNRQGKSHSGAAELSYHDTGLYPDWWQGRRFAGPVRSWAAGVTNEKTRDVVQRKLFGDVGQFGTGFIPKAHIVGNPVMSRGTPGLIDYAKIRHVAGGESWLSFRSYQQGWEKFQSDDIDVAWLDEEPEKRIYTETLARLIDRNGMVFLTFTPLEGMTDIVGWFFPVSNHERRHLTHMTIEDALHIPESRRAEIIATFPDYEREARTMGIPALGSGRVFKIEESLLREDPPEIPRFWKRIVGLDLGGADHATAAVWYAWDQDADVIHIYDTYKRSEPQIAIHAAAIKARGATIPVAWPHDAHQHDRTDGQHYAEIYRKHGLKMLADHAQFSEGGFGLNAGIDDLLDYMETGRFKVASHLSDWFDEYRLYHRKEGKVVPHRDDLMSATRYAHMMRRYARSDRPMQVASQVGMDYDPLAPTRQSNLGNRPSAEAYLRRQMQ